MMRRQLSSNRPKETKIQGQESRTFLVFRIHQEHFAFDIRPIREIINYHKCQELPFMPPFVHGVISLRGTAIPVVDLGEFLKNRHITIAEHSCIVIVEPRLVDFPNQVLGLLVDEVVEVKEVHTNAIAASPHIGTKIHSEHIQGLIQDSDQIIAILNAENILAFEFYTQIEQVATGIYPVHPQSIEQD